MDEFTGNSETGRANAQENEDGITTAGKTTGHVMRVVSTVAGFGRILGFPKHV